MFQPSQIKGLKDYAFASLMGDQHFENLLWYKGLVSAFDYLILSPHYTYIESIEVDQQSLETWGLEDYAAAEIVQACIPDRISLRTAIAAVLEKIAGLNRGWPISHASGWPVSRPLNTVFWDNPDEIYEESIGNPPLGLPNDIAFVFSESTDLEIVQRLLPMVGGDKMLLFHGCSWQSASSIYNSIVLKINRWVADFGDGFYTTPSFHYAMWWALLKLNRSIGVCPAVVVFSIDSDYREKLQVATIAGQEWGKTLMYNRKMIGDLSFDIRKAHVLEGPICRNTKHTDDFRELPTPTPVQQVCFKKPGSTRLLKMEMIILFREGTSIPNSWPRPH